MIAEIIVAVACNLIAVLVLISGIITAKSNGLTVTLVKMFGTLGALVSGYFLTPVLSNKLYAIKGVTELFENTVGISVGTINSCIFFALFMLMYALVLVICNIVRHARIRKLQDKKLNKAKLKRARSINPKAEKAVKRAEWKAAKARYREKRRWYNKLLSCFIGAIVATIVGIVVLMPFGYIFKDIDAKKDRAFLVKGYEYTLNGVIPDSVFDWAVHNKDTEVKEPSEETEENETPVCEHVYEEGVCTLCGETEVTTPVEPEVPVEPETPTEE